VAKGLRFYEGHSINKLQKDIILLIFKIWKFGTIRFVENLIIIIIIIIINQALI